MATQGSAPGLNRGQIQSRAIAGASWTMAHTLVSIPVAFAANIVISRILGVLDYGRLAYLTTIMTVVSGIVTLGLGVGVVQFGSKLHAAGRSAQVQSLLSKSQGFRLLVEVPIMSVVVVLVAHVNPALLVVAVGFGVIVPAALSGAAACLGIENKTAAGAKNAMVINLLTQAVVLAAAFWMRSPESIWVARLAMGSATAVGALLWIAPRYRRAVLRPRMPRGFPAGFWSFAIPAGVAEVLGTLVVSRTEVVALGWMNRAEAAGLFALAFGVAGHLFAPAQALIGPLIPAISGLREVDESAVERAFSRTMRASSTIVAAMLAVAVPLFAGLIPLIYGSPFRAAAMLFVALSLGNGALILAGPVEAFVQSRLVGSALLHANVIALVVDVGLVLVLVPLLGVWGAVIANMAGALSRLALFLRGEMESLAIGWRSLIVTAGPWALGTVSSLAGVAVGATLPVPPVLAAVLAALTGAVLLLVLLRLTHSGLAQDDADAIIRALPGPVRPLAQRLVPMLSHAVAR